MKSVMHTRSFELDAPVDEVFPLFSPEGEKLWAPGWEYRNIEGTTELAEDYVFLTAGHDHRTADAIWVVKAYDPGSHLVQFYKIEPGHKIGVVTVKCSAQTASRTTVQVTYKYKALSAAGEAFVEDFSESRYAAFIDEWRSLLSDYFERKA